jgi:hypothetical protein
MLLFSLMTKIMAGKKWQNGATQLGWQCLGNLLVYSKKVFAGCAQICTVADVTMNHVKVTRSLKLFQ